MTIHWPCYCTVQVYVVIHFLDSMWTFFLLIFFIVCIYMYCLWSSNYQERSGVIPLIDITPPHLCTCPKPWHGFPRSYFVVVFVFSDIRWKVIVSFVDIGGIVDHQCLNFLFIIGQKERKYFDAEQYNIPFLHNPTCIHKIIHHVLLPCVLV